VTATASDLMPRDVQGIRSWEDFGQSLLGGQIDINVHSVANPGGEVRGQVVRAQGLAEGPASAGGRLRRRRR
jgi:hypothetical protein